MKDVKALKITHLYFQPIKMGDFLYYEEPLLSHFIDKDNPNDHYFFRWVDCDDDCHHWFIFKSLEKDIVAFLNRDITLCQMITKNTTIFLVDLDDELNKKQILIATINELPDSYLPSKTSFFNEEHYHAYTLELKHQFEKKISEQSLVAELLKNFNVLNEQQKTTHELLNQMRFVLSKQENISKGKIKKS